MPIVIFRVYLGQNAIDHLYYVRMDAKFNHGTLISSAEIEEMLSYLFNVFEKKVRVFIRH